MRKKGGYFICQQDTLAAISGYWLNKTHRWVADDCYTFWTGLPTGAKDTVMVDKVYFEKTSETSARFSQCQHPYYFYPLSELRDSLSAGGIDIVMIFDGQTFREQTEASEGVWIVARKTT